MLVYQRDSLLLKQCRRSGKWFWWLPEAEKHHDPFQNPNACMATTQLQTHAESPLLSFACPHPLQTRLSSRQQHAGQVEVLRPFLLFTVTVGATDERKAREVNPSTRRRTNSISVGLRRRIPGYWHAVGTLPNFFTRSVMSFGKKSCPFPEDARIYTPCIETRKQQQRAGRGAPGY